MPARDVLGVVFDQFLGSSQVFPVPDGGDILLVMGFDLGQFLGNHVFDAIRNGISCCQQL